MESLNIVNIIIFWLCCVLVTTMIGSTKGEGLWGFILGLFLGPVAVIIALFTKGNRQECPFCRELINKDATRCPRCTSEISGTKK